MKHGAVIFSLAMALLSASCKYVKEEHEIGYKGPAKLDEFLAAKRLVRELGMAANSYAVAPQFPPPKGATLMIPAASLQGKGKLVKIEDWLSDGGHLVVFLTLKERKSQWMQKEPDFAEFLNYFNYEYRLQENWQPNWRDDPESMVQTQAKFPYAKWMEENYQTDFLSPLSIRDMNDENEATETEYAFTSFHSYPYNKGYLTIMATAKPFSNQEIGKAEHATLLYDLLKVNAESEVWFVNSTNVSFFMMLWQTAKEALIILAVFIILFVWWAAKGFGPSYWRESQTVAKLDEHLTASGAFFLKHGAEQLILEELKKSLFLQLARKTNLPFNSNSQSILEAAEQQAILTTAESNTLRHHPTKKELIAHLAVLQSLHKQL